MSALQSRRTAQRKENKKGGKLQIQQDAKAKKHIKLFNRGLKSVDKLPIPFNSTL